MLTSTVQLTYLQGDTWLRVIPLSSYVGGVKTPATLAEVTALASRITEVRLEVRPTSAQPHTAGGDPFPEFAVFTSLKNELRIAPELLGIEIKVPASRANLITRSAEYRLKLIEAAQPEDLVRTLCRGRITAI